MAISPARELKIGKIIDDTLGVLEKGAMPALIFVLVLTAASLPITYASVGSTAPLNVASGQLLQSIVGVVCSYFLLVVLMRRTGLQSGSAEDVFLPYLGMSILSALAVTLGMIALILPGLFLMVRWSIAQPVIVARGGGVMASLGESWERTRGNEFPIFAAALAVLVPMIAVIIAVSVFFEEGNLVGMVVSQIATSGISAVFLAMGVALYGLIVGGASEVAVPSDGPNVSA
jgi:hypothetical protein